MACGFPLYMNLGSLMNTVLVTLIAKAPQAVQTGFQSPRWVHTDARLQVVVLVLHSAGAGKVEVVVFPQHCRGYTRALWGLAELVESL